MRRPLPFHHPPRADQTSRPTEPTIEDLYAQLWRYVRALLPSYRIHSQDAEDVAQTVWMHVHRRRDSYDPQKHTTRRAWITGFVERCATNHRRTRRRRSLTPIEDPSGLLLTVDLDPEQATILRDLHRLIPNDDHRVALLLQVRHGLSIAEIAAVQGVTESAVEWRLSMARKALESSDEDEKKRSGAFLGFGSLEALAEALKPKPIPDEVGEAEWKRIAERIRQEEASPSDEDAAPDDPEPPPSSSAAAAMPPTASPVGPGAATIGTAKLAGLVGLALIIGSGLLAHGTAHNDQAMPAMDAGAVASAAPSTPATSTASAAPSTRTAAPRSTPATSTASAAPSTRTAAPRSTPATSTASAAPSTPATSSASLQLLTQMREAMAGRRFLSVLALAEQHAHRFGATDVRAREALRIEALRQTGRTQDAEQHARAMVTAHPEHRRAIERAAGHALP